METGVADLCHADEGYAHEEADRGVARIPVETHPMPGPDQSPQGGEEIHDAKPHDERDHEGQVMGDVHRRL